MKLNDRSTKQPNQMAREILRTIPEGDSRIEVLRLAQQYASETVYIDVRASEVIRAIQALKAPWGDAFQG